jgi:trigger factor
MKFTVEDINPTRKAVTVTVPATKIAEQESALVKDFAGQVKVSGFRPGKAPSALVKAQFGKNIAEELNNKVVQEGYKFASAETKLKIYNLVDVKTDAVVAGKEAVIRYEVDIQPEFELPEYKGLEIAEEAVEVSDADIEKGVERIRTQSAKFDVVERAAAKGDYVKVSYAGTIDGKPVAEISPEAYLYTEQKSTWEEAGAEEGIGIKSIVNGVVGLKAGDKATFAHEFPADFEKAELAGKKASYAVEVFEVRAKILPEMTEEFFKQLGVKDEADLKTQIRSGVEQQKKNEALAKKRQDVIEALNAKIDFALPESAVDREAYNIFIEFANMQLRSGVDASEIEKQRDELLAGSKDAAKTRVKTQFVLAKIAEAEGLKVEQEELNRRIVQEAHAAKTPVDKFVKELAKDRNRVSDMQRWVLFNKALDVVVGATKTKA